MTTNYNNINFRTPQSLNINTLGITGLAPVDIMTDAIAQADMFVAADGPPVIPPPKEPAPGSLDDTFNKFRDKLKPAPGSTTTPSLDDTFNKFRDKLKPAPGSTTTPSLENTFNTFRLESKLDETSKSVRDSAKNIKLQSNGNGGYTTPTGNRGTYILNHEDGSIIYQPYTLKPGEVASHPTEVKPGIIKNSTYKELPATTTIPSWLIAVNKLGLVKFRDGSYRSSTNLEDPTEYYLTPDGKIYSPNRLVSGTRIPQITTDGATWANSPTIPVGTVAVRNLGLRKTINSTSGAEEYSHPGVAGTFKVLPNGLVEYSGTGTPPGSLITGNQAYEHNGPNGARWLPNTALTNLDAVNAKPLGNGLWSYHGANAKSAGDSMFLTDKGILISLSPDPANTNVYINSGAGWETAGTWSQNPSGQVSHSGNNQETITAVSSILSSRKNRSWAPPP